MKLRNTIYIAALLQFFVLALPVEAKQQHQGNVYHFHEATEEETAFAEKNFASKYHADDYKFGNGGVSLIEYYLSKIEFNDSGQKGYLVIGDSDLYCGTAGCAVDAWQEEGGHWRYIGQIVWGHCGAVKRLKSMTLGYHDLEACGEISRWNGHEYQ